MIGDRLSQEVASDGPEVDIHLGSPIRRFVELETDMSLVLERLDKLEGQQRKKPFWELPSEDQNKEKSPKTAQPQPSTPGSITVLSRMAHSPIRQAMFDPMKPAKDIYKIDLEIAVVGSEEARRVLGILDGGGILRVKKES